jgi:hypothetical protein
MKNLIMLVMLVITANSFSQLAKNKLPKPGSITGKVIDETSNTPLPYVNIVIYDLTKNIINGGITDEKGMFTIKDIPEGKSIVELQFIGFKKYSKQINITNKIKFIDLGIISLSEDSLDSML